jgi:hypothetical protein
MDLQKYKRLYKGADNSPGWEAIDTRLAEVYGDQEPEHWGAAVKYRLGGPDPIDGISAYRCLEGGVEHLHFVTYGYSSLYYDEKAVGGELSGFGFEMTFRLATTPQSIEESDWVCSLLQNLARYVFDSGNWFEQYHWIPTNGTIRTDYDTDLVGLAFLKDPTLQSVDSPHGRVEFIQAFGVTQRELNSCKNKKYMAQKVIEQHRKVNPFLITNLLRTDG